ncbi:division/cell wall cluster transcriptional repressor MraZ [Yimella sp. cx-51]|uniref:division/cell wall cluster transcriptional repressor MraZ n=1 Tax=Yimella sp. cx-51 TaxID=2770551 RepID=UPI00165D9D83|nr:division/cell wall cluster transcriptional repressor MraZ [Yimella sp. cx-51]MBC9957264.1 division/cell wall cluster transcriptional repressor MraZ [Yimella sp. cx-51]MBD2758579.1 division/cell wall cluster transcriptional repressor MraZ [Yimella sp. cx-573]QTH39605.1 division/cell wall cluster transcriptional repressor MraZ [Yimella sp. cx-51]
MFLGTHQPRLDDKGRMILPAKFREKLAAGLVITRGQERCLYVFAMADFEKFAAQMSATPVTNRAVRNFQRVLLSAASDEIPDKQGRITIPAILREYAGLTRDCTVIGAGNRVELWDTQAWNDLLANTEDDFADQAEEVIPGGLF